MRRDRSEEAAALVHGTDNDREWRVNMAEGRETSGGTKRISW